MNKETHDFETWFDNLVNAVLDQTGVTFRDKDSVRQDYDDGKGVFEVADEIAAEYDA